MRSSAASTLRQAQSSAARTPFMFWESCLSLADIELVVSGHRACRDGSGFRFHFILDTLGLRFQTSKNDMRFSAASTLRQAQSSAARTPFMFWESSLSLADIEPVVSGHRACRDGSGFRFHFILDTLGLRLCFGNRVCR